MHYIFKVKELIESILLITGKQWIGCREELQVFTINLVVAKIMLNKNMYRGNKNHIRLCYETNLLRFVKRQIKIFCCTMTLGNHGYKNLKKQTFKTSHLVKVGLLCYLSWGRTSLEAHQLQIIFQWPIKIWFKKPVKCRKWQSSFIL